MHKALVSKRKAQAISTALFLLGIAILIITEVWWPGIMLAIGIPLALRQYLLGRTYDMLISLLIFVGTFVTVQFDINWRIFLPVLFSIGAIYVLFREFANSDGEEEKDQEDDLNHEIEEHKKNRNT